MEELNLNTVLFNVNKDLTLEEFAPMLERLNKSYTFDFSLTIYSGNIYIKLTSNIPIMYNTLEKVQEIIKKGF